MNILILFGLIIVIIVIVYSLFHYHQPPLAGQGTTTLNDLEVKESNKIIDDLLTRIKTDNPEKLKEMLVEDRNKFMAMLQDPTADKKCLDPNYPYYDESIDKCVQCFTNSYNCLTGWQRCHYGVCMVKGSPQCSYYPGIEGISILY